MTYSCSFLPMSESREPVTGAELPSPWFADLPPLVRRLTPDGGVDGTGPAGRGAGFRGAAGFSSSAMVSSGAVSNDGSFAAGRFTAGRALMGRGPESALLREVGSTLVASNVPH